MTSKTPSELCEITRIVSAQISIPPQSIDLKVSKTRSKEVEYRGGFLNLAKMTRQETEEYVDEIKYPLNGWILDVFIDEQIDEMGSKREIWTQEHYYVLSTDGGLSVVTVTKEENHYNSHVIYKAEIEINDMKFSMPSSWQTPVVRVNLQSLLKDHSAYMLDVRHLDWRCSRSDQSYIRRNYPFVLGTEGYMEGAGEYQYAFGEGLLAKLEEIRNKR